MLSQKQNSECNRKYRFFISEFPIKPIGVRRNSLFSYGAFGSHTMEYIVYFIRISKLVISDSGAFSENTTGIPVSLEGYLDFITMLKKTFGRRFIYAIQLDFIPPAWAKASKEELKLSQELTKKNFLKMLSLSTGVRIAPVWHLGEDIEALRQIANIAKEQYETPVVCIGGFRKLGISKAVKIFGYQYISEFISCYSEVQQLAKTHILGVSPEAEILSILRPDFSDGAVYHRDLFLMLKDVRRYVAKGKFVWR